MLICHSVETDWNLNVFVQSEAVALTVAQTFNLAREEAEDQEERQCDVQVRRPRRNLEQSPTSREAEPKRYFNAFLHLLLSELVESEPGGQRFSAQRFL